MAELGEARNDWLHPAARALDQALADCGGALLAKDVAVSACCFPEPLGTRDPGPWLEQPVWGHRDDQPFYPASVMKAFLLAAIAAFAKAGHFTISAEDERAAAAMIRLSSNEATAYLMGRISGAFDGPPLEPEALQAWCRQRTVVQDWYRAMGRTEFAGLQLLHATYQDSPYGRAFQARMPGTANRVSARAAAALMHDIARGALAERDWMMALLNRSFQRAPDYADAEGDQVRGFLTQGLPAEVRVWSKAGHTSKTRHDLLYGECPDGRSFVLSVMSDGGWTSSGEVFLPAFARHFYRHAFGADATAPVPDAARPTDTITQREVQHDVP